MTEAEPCALVIARKVRTLRRASRPVRASVFVTGLFLFVGATSLVPAQPDDTTLKAGALVRKVVTNELIAYEREHGQWTYRLRKEERGEARVWEIIETKDGTLDSLLSRNGLPLTPEQRQKEDARIQKLVNDPDELRKKQQKGQEDAEKGLRLLRLVPDAFVFDYDGKEGALIRLRFKPNPDFHPPSREAKVFHNFEGDMWVDREQERLARIDAGLRDDVKFGGGLLGHLEKGGKFLLTRTEVAPGQWRMTYMSMELKGKAILFKTISVQEKDYLTNFRMLPTSLTLQQAAEILVNTALSTLASRQVK